MTRLNRDFVSRQQINDIALQVIGDKLPGGVEQGIDEISDAQNFAIGSRRELYQWVFRYAYAAGDLAGLARSVINSNYAPGVTGHENEDGFEGNLNSQAAVGAPYVDIADTVARVANWYQGGHFIAFGGTIFHQHHIIASSAGNGTYVRLYLDRPVEVEAITTAMGVTAYRSPYSAVMAAMSTQQEFEPFVGVNFKPVTTGYYFWLCTAGPVGITAHGGTWPGSAAHLRDVFFWMDGTIDPATVADPSGGYQRAGYLLSATGGTGADYGDLWIMLQLDR